jgi:hypothetical protein
VRNEENIKDKIIRIRDANFQSADVNRHRNDSRGETKAISHRDYMLACNPRQRQKKEGKE